MKQVKNYPIGTPGIKWGTDEKQAWLALQQIKRSYKQDVVNKMTAVGEHFCLIQYGALSYSINDYPLFIFKSKLWNKHLPTVLVTGGVHGYETSGVQGAIRFATSVPESLLKQFNFIVAPCVSPWGYETINRWNPNTLDPNRSFYANSPSEEASMLMKYIDSVETKFALHIDLHETTDTDNSEFRPALLARDALQEEFSEIPDGFYLVGDCNKPQDAFQKAIINAVQSVTHIAVADENDALIGMPIAQFGVINYAARELGLCMGLTDAELVTTTEVYPDSPLVDQENCINAQVAAIHAAIDYLRQKK